MRFSLINNNEQCAWSSGNLKQPNIHIRIEDAFRVAPWPLAIHMTVNTEQPRDLGGDPPIQFQRLPDGLLYVPGLFLPRRL